MRRCVSFLARIFFSLGILFISVCEARIIGIVYDDSGSMKNNDNLPSFGAQLLISTLDGSSNKDKLFITTLNDDSDLKKETIGTIKQHQNVINYIGTNWRAIAGNGTPYSRVEKIISEMIRVQEDNEEVFLIIISDGGFGCYDLITSPNCNGMDISEINKIKDKINDLNIKTKGAVRADYLLIAPSGEKRQDTIRYVEQQGIREEILSIFNGSSTDGKYDVKGFDSLLGALRDIVARVSSAEAASLMTNAGSEIEFNSLLSITRVISVSISDHINGPPKPIAESFKAVEKYNLDSLMKEADKAEGWERKLRGVASHFRFQPALLPGEYQISFDKNVNNDVFLLYETEAVVQLDLIEKNGNKVNVDSAGRYQVSVNKEYKIQARLFDSTNNKYHMVPLKDIDDVGKFSGTISLPSNTIKNIVFTRGGNTDFAESSFLASQEGEYTIRGKLRLPGFVSPVSPQLKLVALNNHVDIDTIISPINPKEGNALHIVTGGSRQVAIANVNVNIESSTTGSVVLSLEGGENRYYLGDEQGDRIDQALPFSLNTTFDVLIWADPSWKPSSPNDLNLASVDLIVNTTPPLNGQSLGHLNILPSVPLASLVGTDHSQDSSGKKPFQLSGSDLVSNSNLDTGHSLMFNYYLSDNIHPAEAEHITVDYGGPSFLIDWEIKTQGASIQVVPSTSWWCPCFLGFFNDTYKLDLLFKDSYDIQSAKSKGELSIDINISSKEQWMSCFKIFIVFVLLIYLVGWFVSCLLAQRFPKSSGFKIESGDDIPRYLDLRTGNWTLLKSLLWPITGVPHEVTSLEGITLRARKGGAVLLLNKTDPRVEPESLGEPLLAYLESHEKHDDLKIGWYEQFFGLGTKVAIMLEDINEK